MYLNKNENFKNSIMLSEELKKLIDASLTDGVLTDKERAVIRKRALAENVDPDEVDLLLDSEVQKIQQKKQNDVAKVRKCPNCGAVISGIEVVCPECGYKLTGKAINSTRELADKINAIMTSNEEQYTKIVTTKDEKGNEHTNNLGEENRRKAINQLIRSFPIPNTEEDLLEFLMTMSSDVKSSGDDDELHAAYLAKYKECVTKAKVLFQGNPKFDAAMESTKISWWQGLSSTTRILIILLASFAIMGIIGVLCSICGQ